MRCWPSSCSVHGLEASRSMGEIVCARVYRLGADDIWLSIFVRSLQILLPHWLLPRGRGHSARRSHTGSLARYGTGDHPHFRLSLDAVAYIPRNDRRLGPRRAPVSTRFSTAQRATAGCMTTATTSSRTRTIAG